VLAAIGQQHLHLNGAVLGGRCQVFDRHEHERWGGRFVSCLSTGAK